MSHIIYKYTLEIAGIQTLQVPAGARLLTAQMQGDALRLWAIVNPDNPPEHRTFLISGTGNPFPEGTAAYIATVQQGPFVWHIFEVLQ